MCLLKLQSLLKFAPVVAGKHGLRNSSTRLETAMLPNKCKEPLGKDYKLK
jgi:hypothetical protein